MKLTAKGQVDYWLRQSGESLYDMRAALRSGRRTNALFCGHLSIEKMLKALCAVRRVPTDQIWGHKLIALAQKANYSLVNSQVMELGTITSFNLEARYDDFKRKFNKLCTKQYAQQWSAIIELWHANLKKTVLQERSTLPNNTPAV